jgi:hypothetical protein
MSDIITVSVSVDGYIPANVYTSPLHQPEPRPSISNNGGSFVDPTVSYNLSAANPLAFIPGTGILHAVLETTYIAASILDEFTEQPTNPGTLGDLERIIIREGVDSHPKNLSDSGKWIDPPDRQIFSRPLGTYIGATYYRNYTSLSPNYYWNIFASFVSKVAVPLSVGSSSQKNNARPNYSDLVTGYDLDPRVLPERAVIKPIESGGFRIGYYKRNKLESIPGLVSIDWMEYEYQLIAGESVAINLDSAVLGTLYLLSGSSATFGQIIDLPNEVGAYPYSAYLPDQLSTLFAHWSELYDAIPSPLLVDPSPPTGFVEAARKYTTTTEAVRVLRSLAANNDCWSNNSGDPQDIAADPSHPMFAIDNTRSRNWHISPRTEGIGSLIMDSPRTIEIHAALDAGNYASDDSGNFRVASLGHFIERIAGMLGYRPEPDGTIDQEKERSIFARTLIKPDAGLPVGKYMAGRFGSIGMLMRRLPNRRKNGKWEAGGIVAVHDIPQLVTEVLDQLNQALNIQDSTSIQIRDGADTYEYPNQLALLSEIATGAIQQRRQVREIWASSIVSQQSINEVIAGMGLPTVSKSITINNQKIPYWGIQPDKSLQREIATVGYNVGVATGQLL